MQNADLKVNMFAFPASREKAQNYVTSGVDVLLGVCKDSATKSGKRICILYAGTGKCKNVY